MSDTTHKKRRLTKEDREIMRLDYRAIRFICAELAADLDCSESDARLILNNFLNLRGGTYTVFDQLRNHGISMLVDAL